MDEERNLQHIYSVEINKSLRDLPACCTFSGACGQPTETFAPSWVRALCWHVVLRLLALNFDIGAVAQNKPLRRILSRLRCVAPRVQLRYGHVRVLQSHVHSQQDAHAIPGIYVGFFFHILYQV